MTTRTSILKETLIERARACIGISTYQRTAGLADAPEVFNCFSFMQWLWRPLGVILPDQQLTWPEATVISVEEIVAADLIFVPRFEYAIDADDFDHVGIATGERTVVHATKWRNGVVEDQVSLFLERGCLGVRRIPLNVLGDGRSTIKKLLERK